MIYSMMTYCISYTIKLIDPYEPNSENNQIFGAIEFGTKVIF